MLSEKEIQQLAGDEFHFLNIERDPYCTDYWLEYTTEKGELVIFTFIIDNPRNDVGEKETIIIDFFVNKYTEEIRKKGSSFCLRLKRWIKENSVYAKDVQKGKIAISQGYKVIKNQEFYERYSNPLYIEELKEPLKQFYQQTETSVMPSVQMYDGGNVDDVEWKIKIIGKDGENLAYFLHQLGIASMEEYERRFHDKIVEPCYCLSFYPTEKNQPHQTLSFWVYHLRQLGFCATSYGVPKEVLSR